MPPLYCVKRPPLAFRCGSSNKSWDARRRRRQAQAMQRRSISAEGNSLNSAGDRRQSEPSTRVSLVATSDRHKDRRDRCRAKLCQCASLVTPTNTRRPSKASKDRTRPRRYAIAGISGGLDRAIGHELAHQKHGSFERGAFHHIPPRPLSRSAQRQQNAHRAEDAAHVSHRSPARSGMPEGPVI